MLEVSIDEIFLKGISKNKLLLQNINFTLPPNQIYTIVGKNGSGKTTLIKSISKLLDEDQFGVNGKVVFDSMQLFTADESSLRNIRQKKIKYVFQDAINCFDPLKKLEYYFSLIEHDKDTAEKTLEYFKLPSLNKIGSMFLYELSGGMAQRLLFVLALIANPSLIIMDEPTSGIDVGIANLFLLKMREFISQADHSILIITQDIDFAIKAGGKVALLKETKLSDFVSVNELRENADFINETVFSAYRELS